LPFCRGILSGETCAALGLRCTFPPHTTPPHPTGGLDCHCRCPHHTSPPRHHALGLPSCCARPLPAPPRTPPQHPHPTAPPPPRPTPHPTPPPPLPHPRTPHTPQHSMVGTRAARTNFTCVRAPPTLRWAPGARRRVALPHLAFAGSLKLTSGAGGLAINTSTRALRLLCLPRTCFPPGTTASTLACRHAAACSSVTLTARPPLLYPTLRTFYPHCTFIPAPTPHTPPTPTEAWTPVPACPLPHHR